MSFFGVVFYVLAVSAEDPEITDAGAHQGVEFAAHRLGGRAVKAPSIALVLAPVIVAWKPARVNWPADEVTWNVAWSKVKVPRTGVAAAAAKLMFRLTVPPEMGSCRRKKSGG